MRLSFVLKVLLLIKMYTILIAEEDIFELEFEDVRRKAITFFLFYLC